MSGEPPPLEPPDRVPVPDRHRIDLRRAFETGRREHSDISLSFDRFARGLSDRVRRRLAASPGGVTEERTARVLARSAWADLYLAIACEEQVANSWRILTGEYLPRLRGLLLARGVRKDRVEELLGDLPGWLSTPPPGGRARTRIGTYDGSGSLFGWLAVIAIRREMDRVRQKSRSPGIDLGTIDVTGPIEQDPQNRAEARENADRLRTAIRKAWETLTDRESTVLLLLYREGLRQKEIAGLLGVGKARVSQLAKKGIERLRQELAWDQEGGSGGPSWEGSWKRLGEAITGYLATLSRIGDQQM